MPMAELRSEMEKMKFENVKTLLNSGNVIFDGNPDQEVNREDKIATHLEEVFGFPIPVLIRKEDEIVDLIDSDPFSDIEVTEDIRLYVTFLKEKPENEVTLPWISEDKSYRIIDIRDRAFCSVLDLSVTGRPKLNSLESLFGKNNTRRNWNTVNRIAKKLN